MRVFSTAAIIALLLGCCTVALAEDGRQAAGDGVQPVGELEVGRLYLRTGIVQTSDLEDVRVLGLGRFNPNDRYVIQFDSPITPARRAALNEAGIELHSYLPQFAYIVDVSKVQPAALNQFDFIHWAGRYQNEWKLDPELGQRQAVTPERQALHQQGLIPVKLTIFKQDDPRPVMHFLNEVEAPIHFTTHLAGNPIISTTINQEHLPQLRQLSEVQFVEEASEITPRNNEVRWVVQSNVPGLLPLYDQGLRGEGQIAGILDTNININHCSIADSMPPGPNHRKILAYNTSGSPSTHGNHVSGTCIGDAGGSDNNRGVAYRAKMVYDNWPSFNETAIYNRFEVHHNQGGRVHTNSWGDDGTTAYNGLSRGIDSFQWDYEESLTVWAVTNTSTLKNPENAKNTLAVGATSKAPNQHQHCYGGAGPTVPDSRRKPEIYAPGCSTISANTSSCGTSSLSGTSMASPAVAGVGLLARQYFVEGFYPTGIPTSADGFTPSAALIKAALLNSAVDMTGVSGYPSNQEGWGRVLADATLYFDGDSRRLIVEDVRNIDGLTTGQVDEYEVFVDGSDEKLKITLAFTDYPGAAGTSFAAVNDLDLQVVGPNGTFWGNNFQGGVSAPGGSKDDRNNVEQVHIDNPTPGTWTVRVIAAAVNQQKQGYALVVTGNVVTQEPPLRISLPNGFPSMIDPGTATTIQVEVSDGDESVVPGSETLYYRMSGGSFQNVTLTPLGGDLYEATIPPAACADEPEFYVEAEGDGGTVRTLPSNAPDSTFSMDVGNIDHLDILYEDFNNGLPIGWTMSGLWNVTSTCALSGMCDGPQYAYYGQTASCNYDTGSSANSGTMSSASITLPDVPANGSITLSFCYNLETEFSASWDIARFWINNQPPIELDDASSWTTFTYDLTPFAGQSVTLNWNFDTIDHLYNNFRGWQIDAVTIEAEALGCEDVEPVCPGDLDGNGSVNLADMMILINNWGNCADCGDCPADLDDDCSVGLADLILLIDNWGDCP